MRIRERYFVNRIFRSWIRSYSLLLLIPLVLLVGFYIIYSYQTEKTLYSHWRETTQTVCAEIDTELSQLNRISTYCAVDAYVNSYAGVKNFDDIIAADNRLARIQGVNKALANYSAGIDFVQSTYLHFHASDLLYTGGTFFELAEFDRLPRNAAISYSHKSVPESGSGYIGYYAEGVDVATSVTRYDVCLSTYGRAFTVYTSLNTQNIQRKLTQYAKMFGGWIAVVGNDGRFLYAYGDSACRLTLGDAAHALQNRDNSVLGGLAVYSYVSNQPGLTYICASAYTDIIAQVNRQYWIMASTLVFVVLLGFFMIYQLSKQNYRPTRALASTIIENSNSSLREELIDYPWLISTLQTSYDQSKEMRTMFEENLLRLLLKKRVDDLDISDQSLTMLESILDNDYYLVLCMPVSNRDLSADTVDHAGIDLAQLNDFLLEPIKSRLPAGYLVTGFVIEDYYACLMVANDEGMRQAVVRALHTLSNELCDSGISLTFALSNRHATVLDLHDAYKEAVYAMRINTNTSVSPIAIYDEISNDIMMTYQRSDEVLNHLSNCICAGHGSEALAVISEWRAKVRAGGGPDMIYWVESLSLVGRVLFMNHIRALLGEETFQRYLLELDLLAANADHAFRKRDKALDDYILALSQDIAAAQQINANCGRTSLVVELDKLIQENLCDENLSIGMLADIVNLNPKYMALQYREISGVSLLYSIHQKRIEAFKQLLLEQNITIAAAASAVGYTNLNTLTRWFKKIEGTTPGEYKNTQRL